MLGRAKFRTKKELAKLVRELQPLPAVPDLVAPLGPVLMSGLRNPTWAEFVESLAPAVRELPPGERPRDWANDGNRTNGGMADGDETDEDKTDGVQTGEARNQREAGVIRVNPAKEQLPVGPVPADLPPITSAQCYQLQFTATEEHIQLMERAKALLARRYPKVSLGELHLEAMKLLVASLGCGFPGCGFPGCGFPGCGFPGCGARKDRAVLGR